MARLKPLELDEMAPDVREWVEAKERSGQRGLPRIEAHQPEMARAQDAFGRAIMKYGTLSPRLFELIRLRIAFHNQCRSCMSLRYQYGLDDGVDEGLVCSLERPHEAEDLTDAERCALRYADLFATDHLAIGDELYDELRGHFSEKQIVELGFLCAISVGYGRMSATWDVTDHLPEDFRTRGDAPVGPWNATATITVGRARRGGRAPSR